MFFSAQFNKTKDDMTEKRFQQFEIDGKVAVVIGGARDLGYTMAEALAEAGTKLVITSRSYENSEGQKKYVTEVIANELMLLKGDLEK